MNRICSAIISFPAIAYWRSITSVYCPNECDFTDDILYLIFSSLVSFYIPLTVMIVVYIRIYRAATKQINALKSGQKLNVKSADGTPLTLRIHRGKYHGIQLERKNVNTDNTNPVVKVSYHENIVSKKSMIKSKTDVIRTKMETSSIKPQDCNFNTTNILTALSLSFTNLSTFMINSKSDTSKFESLASTRDKSTKLRRLSCPAKIIYDLIKLDRNSIKNLVKDGEKFKNLPLNIWQGLTLANSKRFWRQRTISLLYYPSLSNEFNQPSAFYLKNQTFTKLRTQRQNAFHYDKNEVKNYIHLSKLEEEESNLSNSFESTCNPISNILSIQNDSVISINNANNCKTETSAYKPFDQPKEISMQSFGQYPKADYFDDDEYAKKGLKNNLLFYQQHYYEHSLTRIKEKNTSNHIFSKFANLFSKNASSNKFDKSSQDSTKPIISNKNKTRINLFRSKQQIKALGLAKKKLNKFSTDQKAAKTLGIVMGVFMICWLPFFILNVFTGISKTTLPDHEIIFAVFTWLGYLNSGCNPIIYAFSSRDFRRAFLKILCPAKFLKKVKETTKSEYYNACNNFTSNASSTNNSYAFKIETKITKPKGTCHLCQVYEERLSKQPSEFEKINTKSKEIDQERNIILNSSYLDLEANKSLVVNLDHQISCSSLAQLNSQHQTSSLSFSSITRNIRRRFQINLNRRKSPNLTSFQRSDSVASSNSLSLLRNVSVNNYRTNSSIKQSSSSLKLNASVLNYSDLRNIKHVPIGTKFNFKQNFILEKSNCVNNFSYKNKNLMNSCDNDNCVSPRLFPKSFLVAINSKKTAKKRPRKRIYSFTSNKSQRTKEL